MKEIKIELSKEDKEMLQEALDFKSNFYKSFEYDDGCGNILPGDISITHQSVSHEGRILRNAFLSTKIRVYGYDDMNYSNYLGLVEYTSKPENVKNILFGEHIIVNQISGERILILI